MDLSYKVMLISAGVFALACLWVGYRTLRPFTRKDLLPDPEAHGKWFRPDTRNTSENETNLLRPKR